MQHLRIVDIRMWYHMRLVHCQVLTEVSTSYIYVLLIYHLYHVLIIYIILLSSLLLRTIVVSNMNITIKYVS